MFWGQTLGAKIFIFHTSHECPRNLSLAELANYWQEALSKKVKNSTWISSTNCPYPDKYIEISNGRSAPIMALFKSNFFCHKREFWQSCPLDLFFPAIVMHESLSGWWGPFFNFFGPPLQSLRNSGFVWHKCTKCWIWAHYDAGGCCNMNFWYRKTNVSE